MNAEEMLQRAREVGLSVTVRLPQSHVKTNFVFRSIATNV